jgi:dihydrodipicolinate synthase/N-acetylneuraminate lyase
VAPVPTVLGAVDGQRRDLSIVGKQLSHIDIERTSNIHRHGNRRDAALTLNLGQVALGHPNELNPLLRFIVDGGLPTTVKAGLDLLGQGAGDPRAPLLPLDDIRHAELDKLLQAV